MEPFEVVHYKLDNLIKGKLDSMTSMGVWLGKSLVSDEHIIGTPSGIRKCRSCYRRPEKQRWEKSILDSFKGVPWQPKGDGVEMRKEPTEGGKRGVYITVDRQVRHGSTKGCPGCEVSYGENPKPHNAECRARFAKLLGRDAGSPAPAEEGHQDAGSAAPMDLESGGQKDDAALKRESLYPPSEAKRAKSSDGGERRVTEESGGQSRSGVQRGAPRIRGRERVDPPGTRPRERGEPLREEDQASRASRREAVAQRPGGD